jgi:hypothetical protein
LHVFCPFFVRPVFNPLPISVVSQATKQSCERQVGKLLLGIFRSFRRSSTRDFTSPCAASVSGTPTKVQARCVGLQDIHKGGKSSAPIPRISKMPCPLASATQGKRLKAVPQGETRTVISLSREGHAPQGTLWAYRSFATSRWDTLHQLVWIVLCCCVLGCRTLVDWLSAFVDFFSHSGADIKCRAINDDEHPHEFCGPYLSRETLYYSPLNFPSEELLKAVLDVMRPVLSLDCSANLMSLLCQTWFRECQAVQHDILGSTMLPSLMVRSMMLES